MAARLLMPEPQWTREEWPGDAWPGYFSRATLHRVEVANSERLARTLVLAGCGAVAVRPRSGADYGWCTPCRKCFPHRQTTEYTPDPRRYV